MAEAHEAEGAAYRWALRVTGIVLGAIAIVGGVVGGIVAGAAGAWGAFAAVAVAAISGLVTQAAMILGYRKEPHVFATYVGGSWLAKMVVIVVGLLALAQVDALHRPTFGIVAIVAVVATLGVDLRAVKQARISYTGSSSEPGSA